MPTKIPVLELIKEGIGKGALTPMSKSLDAACGKTRICPPGYYRCNRSCQQLRLDDFKLLRKTTH